MVGGGRTVMRRRGMGGVEKAGATNVPEESLITAVAPPKHPHAGLAAPHQHQTCLRVPVEMRVEIFGW